jgi:hypothetical protein
MLLPVILLASSPAALAETYHVSATSGDDDRTASEARFDGTPWRTLAKAASAMQSGDVCLIGPGTYRETLRPLVDGVTFRAVTGTEKPIITGCDPVTEWHSFQGKIWRAKVSAEVHEVFAEALMPPARFPDAEKNPFSVDQWSATDISDVKRERQGKAVLRFVDQTWPDGHWDGAFYCGLHGHNFYQANFGRVTKTQGAELQIESLSGALLTNPPEFSGAGRGYLIRHLNALDAPGEWHWQEGTLYLQSRTSTRPMADEVLARVRLWGLDQSGRRNVKVEGLSFFACGALLEGSERCELANCDFQHHSAMATFREDFRFPGERGWYAYGAKEDASAGVFVRGVANHIHHCTFRDCWGQGVHIREGRGNVIEFCEFSNFNWSLLQDGAAIFINGNDHAIRNCRIRNGAAMGISGKQVGPHLVHGVKVVHCDIADTGRVLLDSVPVLDLNGRGILGLA